MAKKNTVAVVEKFPKVGTFTVAKDLQKHYKKLSDDELDTWLAQEGLTYNATDSAPIARMRKCMAILYHHFPAMKPTPKKASPYAGITLEQLVAMAAEHSVPVEVTDNEKIMRMRLIMALRASGKLA